MESFYQGNKRHKDGASQVLAPLHSRVPTSFLGLKPQTPHMHWVNPQTRMLLPWQKSHNPFKLFQNITTIPPCHAWTKIRVFEFKSNNLWGGLIWPTKREGLTQKGKGKGTTTNVGACSPYVCHISSFNLLSQLAKKTLKVKMQTPAHSGQQ